MMKLPHVLHKFMYSTVNMVGCHTTAIVAPDPDCRSREGSTVGILILLEIFKDQGILIEQSSIL